MFNNVTYVHNQRDNVIFTIQPKMSWKFLVNAIRDSRGPKKHGVKSYKIRRSISHSRVLAMLHGSF